MIRISEIIFCLFILSGIYLNKSNIDGGNFFIGLASSLMAFNYLLFGFLILNNIRIKKIFKSDSYQKLSKGDIAISIFGGLVLSIQVFGITFLLMNLEGASFMYGAGVVLGGIIVLLLAVLSIFRNKIKYTPLLSRTLVLTILLFLFKNFSVYPQKNHILKDDHILLRLLKEQKNWPDPDAIYSKVIKAQQKRVKDTSFKEGDFITYYYNGDTASVVHYVKDTLHGEYKIYGNNNQTFQTGKYNMGNPVGVHKQFYTNGKLKSYRFHDPELGKIFYSKRFDENGNQVDGVIAIKMPNRITQDTLEAGINLRLGFSLEHSMYETPRIHMYLIDKTSSINDTIAIMGSDTSFLEYDIEIKKGINMYQVELFELDGKSDTVRGTYKDDIIYFGR